jgi:multidrug efflux pump
LVIVTVHSVAKRTMRNRRTMVTATVGDDSGRISIVFFNQPWRERQAATPDVAADLQKHLDGIRGVRVRTQVGGGLVRSQGQPFQIVLGGPEYAEIAQWRDRMLARMADNPGLVGPDSDYKETRPQMRVNIDRQRAADLGVSVTAIGSALETMMGSRRVTTFVDNGEEYDVLVQAGREGRASPADLEAIQVRSSNGDLVPLSNLVTLSEVAEPGSLNRFNRLRAISISAGRGSAWRCAKAAMVCCCVRAWKKMIRLRRCCKT